MIGADLGQHQVDGRNLPLAIGMRRVHDMQQQVGVHGLFQSASKSGDQIVRKVLDETHGVRNDDRFRARQLQTPQCRIERRKELVKVIRKKAEEHKVAVRNIRHHAVDTIKTLLKNHDITEDANKRANDQVQKITDKYVKQIDELLGSKEKEIMEV